MSLKNTIKNFDKDFSSKVMLTLRETALIAVQELIEFINVNNRRRIRIVQIDTEPINDKIFGYCFKYFDFENLVINNKESLLKNIEKVLNVLEHDTNFIEHIKEFIKKSVNPVLYEFDQEGSPFVPAIYDDLTYFSFDTNTLLDRIELKLFDEKEIKKTSAEISTIQLNTFDPSLYNKIITNPVLIHSTTWRDFEYLLKEILSAFEYEVELQKGTKDGGIDIIAIKKNDIFGEHKYLIQAKKWKNKVGVEPVQRLAFLKDYYNVSKACLATTSTFTKGAWDLAKMYPWQLELKDYNGLLDWMKFAKLKS